MNSGWHLAATHYQIRLPNEPRLGWSPPKHDAIQLTAIAAMAAAFFYSLYAEPVSVLAISIAGGFAILVILIVLWNIRKSKAEVPSDPLTDEELRKCALSVQCAALNPNSITRDNSVLGSTLMQRWTIPTVSMIYAVLVVFWPHQIYFSLTLITVTFGRLGLAALIGSSWIEKFKQRIQKRDCVGCGYTPGGPLEVVTICPECGVILPLHYRTGPDPPSGPPFAVSPSR